MNKYSKLTLETKDDGRPIFVHMHNWGTGWIFTELSFTGRITHLSRAAHPEYKVIELDEYVSNFKNALEIIEAQTQKNDHSFISGIVSKWANDRATA